MFQKFPLQHKIVVEPCDFCLTDDSEVLLKNLQKIYLNKIVPEFGLCLGIESLLEIGDRLVSMSLDGAYETIVKFQAYFFNPYTEEIIEGNISKICSDYLKVSCGFFDDIYIHRTALPPNTTFDEVDQQFVWTHSEDTKLYFCINMKVWVRVKEVRFATLSGAADEPKMSVQGSMTEHGLGNPEWWVTNEDDASSNESDEGDDDEDAGEEEEE